MKLFGKKVLFTDERIVLDKLPKGVYRYELRENNGNICEISDKIFVDFYGTILSYKPIVLNSDGYRDIDEDKDVEYSSEPGNLLKQYMIELEFTKSYRLIQ